MPAGCFEGSEEEKDSGVLEVADVLEARLTILTSDHWSYSGETGRRCCDCFRPIPLEALEDMPEETLDGRQEVFCRDCQKRRLEDRQRFLRIKSGKATEWDFCTTEAERWRKKIEEGA